MISNAEITKVANELQTQVLDALNERKSECVEKMRLAEMAKDDYVCHEMVKDVIDIILDAYANAKAENGSVFPKVLKLFRIAPSGQGHSLFLTLKTIKQAELAIKRSVSMDINESCYEEVVEFCNEVIYYLFYIDMAQRNITDINERLAEITESEHLNVKLQFQVTDGYTALVRISDREVILRADISSAVDITSIGMGSLLKDDYSKTMYQIDRNNYVRFMQSITNAPSLLKARLPIIEKLGCLNTRKRADKIIREVYHKRYENTKSGEVGYYDKDGVFALVKNVNGRYENVLSPFNSKDMTNENVIIG